VINKLHITSHKTRSTGNKLTLLVRQAYPIQRSRADFRHFQASTEDLLLHVILDVLGVQRIRDFFW